MCPLFSVLLLSRFSKAYSGNVESITLGVIPLELNCLIYVANGQHYYPTNDLSVTFKSYDSGFDAMKGMLNGGKVVTEAVTENGKAIITVEDNGEGIPESVRSKLFMPLVATKSKGQGFGYLSLKGSLKDSAEQ